MEIVSQNTGSRL